MKVPFQGDRKNAFSRNEIPALFCLLFQGFFISFSGYKKW
jgi:hypothetical protein